MPTRGMYIRTNKIKRKISNSVKGFKHSEVIKRKMSRLLKKRWKDPKYRKEKIKSLKKLRHSIKTKKIMSNKRKIYWRNPENKLKITGKNNPRWKGGVKRWHGYIFIYCPFHPHASKNYVPEHRLMVEKKIGRYLLSIESTHHLGAKDDNRCNMLMAFSSHSAHIRFHNKPNNVKPEETIFDGRKLKH